MKYKNGILHGAIYLGLSAFISKLLGAIYRVPLTNMLGGYGLGLYQMVFPVYSLLLDFSGAGVPSALSRLISKTEDKYQNAHQYLNVSLRVLLTLGLVASLFMAVFSRSIARLQGNEKASLAYLFLSPAICLVSLISCFRGYFQGLMDMRPTALSQVIEQAIKLALGVVFVKVFIQNIEVAVAGATLAISISELLALLILYFTYKRHKSKLKLNFIYNRHLFKQYSKKIIITTIPITLVGIMIPLSQVFDSFLIINILSKYLDNATTLYGLLSGVVMTVINLPVSICYGLATVAIPTISSSKSSNETNNKTKKILLLTLLFALPCAIFLFFFAPFCINMLFKNLSLLEKEISIKLLKLTSLCVVFLALIQATNAVLIGKGRLYVPVITLLIGVIIKTVLNIFLLNNSNINIYGGAIAIIACYFSVCLINLIILKLKGKSNENNSTKDCQY